MFNKPIKSDQNNSTALIQQCLANYDYSNATFLAENLLLNQGSEENKGLLADCYLAQQENYKAYFLLKNSTSPTNLYKLAVTYLRLNNLAEAEAILTRERFLSSYNVPNGAFGLQLLATIYEKQNKLQQATEYYEKSLKSNPKLLSIQRQLEKIRSVLSDNEGITEAPEKSLLENHSEAGEVRNQPVLSQESIGSGKKFSDLETKKEDQSPEEKSFEIIDSPSVASEKPISKERKIKYVVPVDQYFDEEDCEVYVSEEGEVYYKVLNQSNVMQNNNKFYIIQILQSRKDRGTYFLWCRFGRVGSQGQNVKTMLKDPKEAIQKFEQKWYDKTVKGDYTEIEMNFPVDEKEEEITDKVEEEKSELPEQVQELLKLIFDEKKMIDQLKMLDYAFHLLPIEKLSQNIIQKAYETLTELTDALEKKSSMDDVKRLSNQFYSLIPHDFGLQPMSNFIIDSDVKIKGKLEMLDSLENIRTAFKLLNQEENPNNRGNLIDKNYKKLNCGLNFCEKDSDEYKMVLDYIKNTHASTHSNYTLELQDLFSVQREGEAERFTKDLPNKQLLWYGSRLSNYVGILSQGLKIAPPEAPLTAFMFGKGVYFADMVSKSANYCFVSPGDNTGLMLLCEVALGDCNEKLYADSNAANLPAGKHSTKGVGRTAPDADEARIIDGDVIVPMGKAKNTGIQGGALLYNEYVVYDVKQIKIRYLVKVKFNYKYGF